MSIRPIVHTHAAQPTMEGAGVKLHRAFGFSDPTGFPWHPHRGIETITYVLSGSVDHGDSLGNQGTLSDGDLQWMTAGSGILHQEMPKGNAQGQMHGFQLWANLPSSLKMTTPRYQDIKSPDLPLLEEDDGCRIKVLIGAYQGIRSPVDGIAASPQYLDVYIPPGVHKQLAINTDASTFAYVFDGAANFAAASNPAGVLVEKTFAGEEVNIRDLSGNRTLVQFGNGKEVSVRAGSQGVRFLLVSGTPIKEPVAWHGPIVMNTQAEIRQAIHDLHNDQFIKSH